ncbi:XRE family transcriptional regulator [Pseudoflavonifractor sp. 60]|uniref:helix-turn-helix domain-containing protein n=1 Tax=Pseudoflavonifractor sp. 60 TaxID=2304576 RepID=UPI0013681614|nr:helix-turn-helix transcriptional regulator [Pseudoflavonifractor sp. 60]NBI67595.1 XRE family transcriptional regulator [Pseudoflavonifractor sp. 60]
MYQRIRDMREDSDMSQTEIAAKLNCSQQIYSNYELGRHTIPPDILTALAIIHKTSIGYLLGLTNV